MILYTICQTRSQTAAASSSRRLFLTIGLFFGLDAIPEIIARQFAAHGLCGRRQKHVQVFGRNGFHFAAGYERDAAARNCLFCDSGFRNNAVSFAKGCRIIQIGGSVFHRLLIFRQESVNRRFVLLYKIFFRNDAAHCKRNAGSGFKSFRQVKHVFQSAVLQKRGSYVGFGQQIEIMQASFASIENPDKFLTDLKQQLDLLIEPTAIELTIQYMWLTAFLGTFASLLAALFAVSARRRKPDIRL